MNELQKELFEQFDGDGNVDHIASEFADVSFCMRQIELLLNDNGESFTQLVKTYVDFKVARQETRNENFVQAGARCTGYSGWDSLATYLKYGKSQEQETPSGQSGYSGWSNWGGSACGWRGLGEKEGAPVLSGYSGYVGITGDIGYSGWDNLSLEKNSHSPNISQQGLTGTVVPKVGSAPTGFVGAQPFAKQEPIERPLNTQNVQGHVMRNPSVISQTFVRKQSGSGSIAQGTTVQVIPSQPAEAQAPSGAVAPSAASSNTS